MENKKIHSNIRIPCPSCKTGTLYQRPAGISVNNNYYASFFACTNYPTCIYAQGIKTEGTTVCPHCNEDIVFDLPFIN